LFFGGTDFEMWACFSVDRNWQQSRYHEQWQKQEGLKFGDDNWVHEGIVVCVVCVNHIRRARLASRSNTTKRRTPNI
jgi:hypothetical protein